MWLTFLVVAVGGIFWYNELQYQLPTPVPKDYKEKQIGSYVKLPVAFAGQDRKPLLLHFFNPDCPCSRFNIQQFKAIVQRYGDRVDFRIVALTQKQFSEQEIQQKFDLDIPVTFDQNLAELCGVYATPQAALLDANHHLYYRGNYNRSRYCADEKTNYARIAIDGLLAKNNHIKFNKLALVSYGCTLPGCEN